MIDIDIVLDPGHNKKLSISRYFDPDLVDKEYLDNEIVTFSIYNGPGLSKLGTSGEMEITQLVNRINNGEF